MKKSLLLLLGITGVLLIQAQSLMPKSKKSKKEPIVAAKPIKPIKSEKHSSYLDDPKAYFRNYYIQKLSLYAHHVRTIIRVTVV